MTIAATLEDDRPGQPAFDNLYTHGFARMAIAVPRVKVADPVFNAKQTVAMMEAAQARGAALVLFPELGLSAYTCDDLFHQKALLDACEDALAEVVAASRRLPIVAVVGLPLRVDHRLFNCAAVVHDGRVLGVLPKTFLPNYSEFYEARQFASGDSAVSTDISLLGQTVPFGAALIFEAIDRPLFRFHAEICEDVWVPVPPSSFAALAGATVLLNLSASNITIGKSGYRHRLVSLQSARCVAAYLYSSAGVGESTTDLAWDGQSIVYENGELLAESQRFATDSHLVTADVDLDRLSRERMRQTTYGQSAARHAAEVSKFRTVRFTADWPTKTALPLERTVERFPYVPADASRRDERCEEVYNIQVQALVQRLTAAGVKKVVIGVSGGLDSTHALLVCARAMDLMKLPRDHILGYTMPGFATSDRTLDQALRLMEAVGCSARTIDIRPSCEQMLKDLGHPYAEGAEQYDITFENVQAGERTSHLFRLANFNDAIVVGTGDLSELALGWCTYGVGDHMSHYNVNASVPKTLIKHLVRWVADTEVLDDAGSRVLMQVLATEVSPELVPASKRQAAIEGMEADAARAGDTPAAKEAQGDEGKQPNQSTEDVIGPYELQDFNLFHILRYGFAPTKVAFLARAAWGDRDKGRWPEGLPAHNEYSLADIKKHLGTFVWRFFKTSQFKRSTVPNAPKVGSGGSLSPRGDWRAPSDSEATVWLADVARIPDKE